MRKTFLEDVWARLGLRSAYVTAYNAAWGVLTVSATPGFNYTRQTPTLLLHPFCIGVYLFHTERCAGLFKVEQRNGPLGTTVRRVAGGRGRAMAARRRGVTGGAAVWLYPLQQRLQQLCRHLPYSACHYLPSAACALCAYSACRTFACHLRHFFCLAAMTLTLAAWRCWRTRALPALHLYLRWVHGADTRCLPTHSLPPALQHLLPVPPFAACCGTVRG